MRQVEVIEKPFHYFRGKWRQGDFALVTGGIAVVFYGRGMKSRRMKATGVFSSEKMLESYKRKYHEGWIVIGTGFGFGWGRDVRVTPVRLEFANHYYRGSHFRFVPRSEEGPDYTKQWMADQVLSVADDDTKFFTTELAALRYAERLQRGRVRQIHKRLKKPEAALDDLQKRISALRKGA